MTIKKMIEDAEANADKWRSICARGTHAQHDKTEVQAIALREYFEGRLDGLVEAKRLMKDN
jgi:hypothetical protein